MRIILGVPRDQQSSEIYATSWDERNYAPNAVPIEFGTNLNLSSGRCPHKLKASTGIRGRSMTVGGLEKDDASDIANLANAKLPKYAASILFLKVIAYILRQYCISWVSNTDKLDIP